MGTRIKTGLLLVPFVVGFILLGNPWLKYAILFLSLVALHEMYDVLKNYKPIKMVGYLALILHFTLLDQTMQYYSIYVSIFIMLTLIIMVTQYPKYSVVDAALTIFSTLYVGLLFSFIVLIQDMNHGEFWIWLIAISSWGSDTCAYFTGIAIGKHKLAPILSPKKTIEGSIGGVLGAGIIGCLYSLIYMYFVPTLSEHYIIIVVIIVMLGAIISQFGDLAASAIKRHFEVKDFGKLLPGHGGILDRFDSILFVAPTIYIAVLAIQSMS